MEATPVPPPPPTRKPCHTNPVQPSGLKHGFTTLEDGGCTTATLSRVVSEEGGVRRGLGDPAGPAHPTGARTAQLLSAWALSPFTASAWKLQWPTLIPPFGAGVVCEQLVY